MKKIATAIAASLSALSSAVGAVERGAERLVFMLEKSFGYIDSGRHVHLPAGTLLNTVEHGPLITQLFADGAQLKQMPSEPDKAAKPTPQGKTDKPDKTSKSAKQEGAPNPDGPDNPAKQAGADAGSQSKE